MLMKERRDEKDGKDLWIIRVSSGGFSSNTFKLQSEVCSCLLWHILKGGFYSYVGRLIACMEETRFVQPASEGSGDN